MLLNEESHQMLSFLSGTVKNFSFNDPICTQDVPTVVNLIMIYLPIYCQYILSYLCQMNFISHVSCYKEKSFEIIWLVCKVHFQPPQRSETFLNTRCIYDSTLFSGINK